MSYYKIIQQKSLGNKYAINLIYAFTTSKDRAKAEQEKHYRKYGEVLKIEPINSSDFVIMANNDEKGTSEPFYSAKSEKYAVEIIKNLRLAFPFYRYSVLPLNDFSLSTFFI